jgi:hypothetical protein
VGGEPVERGACPPDADGLRGLADRLLCNDGEVLALVESMNGARFVHDQLERHGLDVLICDAGRTPPYEVAPMKPPAPQTTTSFML